MDNKFKIFNHSRTDSAVIEFKKNSDGVVEFPYGQPDSLAENRTAVGFCVSGDPFDSRTATADGSEITLTSFPIGVVGWVDVETDDEYVSYRYEGLTTHQRKVDWLEMVTDSKLTVTYTPNGFKFKSSYVSEGGVKVRFRDEDIPYGLGDFKRVVGGVISPLNDGAQVITTTEGLYMFFETAGEPEPLPGVLIYSVDGSVTGKMTGQIASMETMFPDIDFNAETVPEEFLESLNSVNVLEFRESVTSIEGINIGGFFNSLERVIINITGSIGDEVFAGTSITEELYIGPNVTSIGNASFAGNRLEKLTLSEGLISIGNAGFAGVNGVTELTIPDSVTSLGNSAFSGWSSSNPSTLTIGSGIEEIRGDEFSGWNKNSGATNLILKEGIKRIGTQSDYALQSFGGESLTIPNSVEFIGKYCFQSWENATSLTIGSGPVVISDYAFHGWTSAKTISLGGTTSIGKDAFLNWTGIEQVLTIPSSVTYIANDAFLNWEMCKGLIFEEGIIDVYPEGSSDLIQTFTNWYAATMLRFADSMTNYNLGFTNWYNCADLKIGSGVSVIGAPGWARGEFTNLGSAVVGGVDIDIPDNVISICAFAGGGMYPNFTLGTGIQEILGLPYNVTNFTVRAATPPRLVDFPMMPNSTPEITVYVPDVETYVADADWAKEYNVQTSETRFTLFEKIPDDQV